MPHTADEMTNHTMSYLVSMTKAGLRALEGAPCTPLLLKLKVRAAAHQFYSFVSNQPERCRVCLYVARAFVCMSIILEAL